MRAKLNFPRLVQIAKTVATLDFSLPAYSLWLRYHRLEYGPANYVSPADGEGHTHSGGPKLKKVIRSLHIPEGSVACDLGSGMGIAAITLSPFFSSVIGVEKSPELVAAAQRNIAKLRVTNIKLQCVDARNFSDGMDRVTHVYMFNPFPETVMARVVENLGRSIIRVPRRLVVIYKNPICHETIVAAGFIHKCDIHLRHSHPFAIYEA